MTWHRTAPFDGTIYCLGLTMYIFNMYFTFQNSESNNFKSQYKTTKKLLVASVLAVNKRFCVLKCSYVSWSIVGHT